MFRIRRVRRRSSPQGAVFVRLAAFATTIVTLILVPIALGRALGGHGTMLQAGTASAIALAACVASTIAAKSMDPLRR